MVMTKFDDNEIIRVRQGWAKVVLNFPSSVNVIRDGFTKNLDRRFDMKAALKLSSV